MVVRALVEPLAADDAQAGAVRPAQRRDRLGQRDRLADGRLEVELVVVGQAGDVGLVVGGQGPARGQVDGRQELLLETQAERDDDVAQAAAALDGEGGLDVRADEDAAVRPGNRTLPSIGAASRRSSPRSIVTPSIGSVALRTGGSPSSPATFQTRPVSVGRRGHRGARVGSPSSSSQRSSAGSDRSSPAPSTPSQARPALVEQGDPLLDALERLDDVALEADEDADRVLVGAAPDVVGVARRRSR